MVQTNDEKIKRQREKVNEICHNVKYVQLGTIIVLVITLALFCLNWASIYNSTLGGTEVKISGWNCFIAGVTGKYTSTDSVYGDIAIPFNYYAQSLTHALSIVTVIATFVAVIAIIAQVGAFFRGEKIWNMVGIACGFLLFVLLLTAFILALSMSGSKILPVYCSGNTACSIRSLAIIPALCALATAVLNIVSTTMYLRAEMLVK